MSSGSAGTVQAPHEVDKDRQGTPSEPPPRKDGGRNLLKALSFRNISAIYVFIAIWVLFALWIPETFLDASVWKTLLSSQVITALVSIALVVPLAAGAFNLAVGAQMGLAGTLVAWFMVRQGMPIVPAILLTLIIGSLIGLVMGLVIVRARIESFIATLGIGSVLAAFVAWISNSEQIVGLSQTFSGIATTQVFGLTLSVYIMVVVALGTWYVLERTALGRRVYATGGNAEAARLAGVRTSWIVIGTLVACGTISSFAGVLQSATISTGDPTIGPEYMLPAFTAAFLGSTQFRSGRFNIWGTVVAVYVLATGIKGLQLAGAPVWIPDLFNGLVLLIAVGLSQYERIAGRGRAIDRLLRRGRDQESAESK